MSHDITSLAISSFIFSGGYAIDLIFKYLSLYKNVLPSDLLTKNLYRTFLSYLLSLTIFHFFSDNKDNFDLPSLSSPHNLFLTHSVQGRQHRRSYLHTLRTVGLRLAFVAVDATPLPGPKRPFNFVGKKLKIFQDLLIYFFIKFAACDFLKVIISLLFPD